MFFALFIYNLLYIALIVRSLFLLESLICFKVRSLPEIVKIRMLRTYDHRRDHDENRRKLCAPCERKISLRNKKIDYFRITENVEKLIPFINVNFSVTNSK